MWQLDPRLEAPSYPKGGVAPSRYDLALFNYIQKTRARFIHLQEARPKSRARWRRWRDRSYDQLQGIVALKHRIQVP